MEKLNQSNESSQNFEAEPKLPQIETVHLTTFEELHDYMMGDVFLSPIFEVKIPNFLFSTKLLQSLGGSGIII
jgi:hypothetical protein